MGGHLRQVVRWRSSHIELLRKSVAGKGNSKYRGLKSGMGLGVPEKGRKAIRSE